MIPAGFVVLSMDELLAYLQRIETKLDVLIGALAAEEDDAPATDLEGLPLGRARDTDQPL